MATYVGRRPFVPAVGRAVAWLAVLAAVGAGVHYGYGRYRSQQAAAAAPQYFLQPASIGPVVRTAVGAGSFEPAATQSVAPQVAGTVSQVDVALGEAVAANQTLFQMSDTAGLSQQLASAEAKLAAAQRQLQQLEDPALTTDPRTLEQDQLQIQQAQLTLNQAQWNLQAVQAAAAAATAVTTPVGGTVQAVAVTTGQSVPTGAAIATVLPSGNPTIAVQVPQQDLPFLPVGTAATVLAPALGATYAASVGAIGLSAAPGGTSGAAAGGTPSSSASSSALYPITVVLSGTVPHLPDGADVGVTFQPTGNPPSVLTWTDGGTVSYPAPVTVSAQQAGTVSGLPAVGAAVRAGQQVATVTPAAPPAAVAQDQAAVAQDTNSLQQAQLTLQQAQAPLPPTAQAVAVQESAVATAQDAVQADQQDLADLTVRAPVAGVVQSIAIQPGTRLAAGTSAITLQSAGALKAVADVDELDISQIKAGESATVAIGAFPNQEFQATVTGIAPTATTQFGVTYYGVDLAVTGLPTALRAGMTLNATILINEVSSTLRVPAWAVTTFGGAATGIVRVMNAGRPQPVPVKLGLTSAQFDQVLSGLTSGEQVVAGDTAAASTTSGLAALFLARGGGPGFVTRAAFAGGGGRGGGRGGG